MSLRRYILATVTANLALVGALLWQTARPAAPVTRAKVAVSTHVSTEVAHEPTAPLPEAKAPSSPQFHWSQIESTNYLVTLTNLLDIGCPKETVRDILDARVEDDFRARLRELTRPAQARYWDVVAEGGDLKDLFDGTSIKEASEALKAEEARVHKELESVLNLEPQAEKQGRDERLSHLSVEKQAAITAMEIQHAKERAALKIREDKAPATDRAAREMELHTRQRTQRRAIFSDAEWEEDQLRRAAEQNVTVRELRGFAATPEQLRSLQLAWRNFEDENPGPTKHDLNSTDDHAAYSAKVKAREEKRKEMLTTMLGEAGFAAFERGSDPRFHILLKLARRLDQPPATAAQWLALQSTAQDQARLIRENSGFDENTRAAALNAIRVETERTLRNAVGARGWGAYQRSAGEWLKQLSE